VREAATASTRRSATLIKSQMELAKISAAGFAGTTITFVNCIDELPFFIAEVPPRLEAKTLRIPFKATS
jgi:hypothetical protein